MNSEQKTCQNCKNEFTIEPEDFQFYEKVRVPAPTFCPVCRMQRRMTVRNERSLYKDTCDLCEKSMVSMYSPDKSLKVYCRECWFSDNWDPLEYGMEYDWNKPFFQQYRELVEKVPHIAIAQYHVNVNCDFANYVADSKNIYLAYSILDSEDVYYSRFIDKCKTCFDSFNIENSEIIYENIDGNKNNRTDFLYRSRECLESAFLFDCSNCQNCFMSSNLRGKQYVFKNQQLSKEQYKAEVEKINLGSFQQLEELKKEFKELILSSLHKFANLTKTENCTGDNIRSAKNSHFIFDAYDIENCKYGTRILGTKECYDMFGCAPSELMYEYVAGGFGSYNSRFSTFGESTRNSEYTYWCHNSNSVFCCSGVRKKEYCILNKQYSKEEYEELVLKIRKHMNEMPYKDKKGRVYKYGEFFPIEVSLFGYNETIAQEYMPITKEEAEEKGYPWRDPDPYPHKPTVQPNDIQDDIKDVDKSILKEVIACYDCGRAYRILKAELDFLKFRNIAIPRKCENCRYKERFAMRNPLNLWHRQCMCNGVISDMGYETSFTYKNTTSHFHGGDHCLNEFETSYSPERKEIVYCEACYQQEVV